MTRDYNINTSESNNTINKKRFHIWLVNSNGGLLIKNFQRNIKNIYIKDLTITASSLDLLTRKIEILWKVKCNFESFKQVYNFVNEQKDAEITGYILEMHLNSNDAGKVAENFKGRFIDYRELDSIVRPYHKTLDFIEGYISVVDELDKVYGIQTTDYIHV